MLAAPLKFQRHMSKLRPQMENNSWSRYCKFFRGLIASRQPHEIIEIVDKYNKQLKAAESNYIDIVIKSQGLLTYQEIMTMPVDRIVTFVERLNVAQEERKQAMEAAKMKKR